MEEDDEFGDLYTDVLSSFSLPTPTPTTAVKQTPATPPPPPLPAPSAQQLEVDNLNSGVSDEIRTTVGEEEQIRDFNLIDTVEEKQEEIEEDGISKGENFGINNSDNSSDSEDDLQIVLNESDPIPNGVFHDDDDDDGLIIVRGDDAAAAAAPDDGDWGEDGIGKDPSAAAAAVVAKPPRPNFGAAPYHQFPSQFKYVRPGAAVLPTAPPGQVRPPLNVCLMSGRGRGDLKGPPTHKGFQPGYWGGPGPPRGLDFTLPSHKTIFEVDIDNFEEKPWKHPGVDVSDFFNFSLNEESWKDYCKQLELSRLGSTMQSKIRVYESGRAEQEYDPDLPPELAAAVNTNGTATENADIGKAEGGSVDPAKEAANARPLLVTGRPIPVETGYGERLPSADTRPPRLRDSDAIVEIVLQESDDESGGNSDTVNPDTESGREDDQVGVPNEDGPSGGNKVVDESPQRCDVMAEDAARKGSPRTDSPHSDSHSKEREISSPGRASSDHHSGSKDHDSTDNVGSPSKKRWTKETSRERSPQVSSGESAHDRRSLDYQREDSIDSMERKRNTEASSIARVGDDVEGSVEGEAAADDDISADKRSGKSKEYSIQSAKQEKPSRQVEPSRTKDDDGEEFDASRSSDTWREGVDGENKHNDSSTYTRDVKRHRGDGGHVSRRKDVNGRVDMEKNYVSSKGREDYYRPKERDPYAGNQFYVKPEVGDQRKDRDYSDPHGRRTRDEVVPKNRRKVNEIDRSEKDEYLLQSQKYLENESWRSYHHEKDPGLARYREKDDFSKGHEILDDHHGKKRRKDDDDFMRRDHMYKHDTSRGKRDKEEVILNQQRKRDDHPKVNNHHGVRLKEEVWAQRERAELQRDRDEWYQAKQSYDENMYRKRNSRVVEEKMWVESSHGRDEYKSHDKGPGRHGEHLKRRERVPEEMRKSQILNEEGKRPRQEKSAFRNDRVVGALDNLKLHEEKLKDSLKRARESEGRSTSGTSKRRQGEKGVANDTADVKGMSEKAVGENDTSLHNLPKVGVSSDDEQQESRRGRSKLERWSSHKDRDREINPKSSSSLKFKETRNTRNPSGSTTTVPTDETTKNIIVEENNPSLDAKKDSSGGSELKDDKHMDTVERLKKRKERFKLELACEKDPPTINKLENESNAEVKPERPPRKRRWLSNS